MVLSFTTFTLSQCSPLLNLPHKHSGILRPRPFCNYSKDMDKSNCVINDDDQDWGSSGAQDLGMEKEVSLVSQKKKLPPTQTDPECYPGQLQET